MGAAEGCVTAVDLCNSCGEVATVDSESPFAPAGDTLRFRADKKCHISTITVGAWAGGEQQELPTLELRCHLKY